MLTPEGGIPILYKDQDRGWFLMVLRVFAWIMATGVGGWLIARSAFPVNRAGVLR